jgi:SAM-dependent methyltransferase
VSEYTRDFFEAHKESARASAEVVVPIVMDLIKPGSVIDLGCGLGTWLSVWREAGCDVTGVDGDWVDKARLAIPADRFIVHDLSSSYTLDGSYDLAMSLEAAEHLPSDAAARLVNALTKAAPVVLFSAAAPNQAGRNHINCQWPAYWAELFAQHDFVVIDSLRYLIWETERVDWWYRQNIMIYVARDLVARWPKLESMHREGDQPLRLVHPGLLKSWIDWGMEQSSRYWDLRERRGHGQ